MTCWNGKLIRIKLGDNKWCSSCKTPCFRAYSHISRGVLIHLAIGTVCIVIGRYESDEQFFDLHNEQIVMLTANSLVQASAYRLFYHCEVIA